MVHSSQKSVVRFALTMLVILLTVVFVAGQTSQKKKKRTTGKSTKALVVAKSDSLARADSLRKVFEAKVVADSIRNAEEAARKAAEARKKPTLRVIRNDAFGVGERLVFDVNYGFVTAGEAVMWIPGLETVTNRSCFHVQFQVNSLPSFSWIYKVEDKYSTFIDVETIAPWRFEQHIREGNYSRDFIADFDQIKLVAKTTEGEYAIPAYVHDIMSAFYFARTMDFSNSRVGDIVVLNNFYKDKTYELGVKFLGRQELEVVAGTFNTVVLEPMVKEGGLFKSEGRIVIWLSDDDRKIPVRVNTKVVIGSIDTELREYSGLIGPLRARTK